MDERVDPADLRNPYPWMAQLPAFQEWLAQQAPRKPTELERRVVKIARVCYEANRAYCLDLGDTSFAPWEDAPDWQRITNVRGVLFHLSKPDATDSASHDSWLAEKRADGWKYGPVKDADKKEHPCFVPFDELPPEQQRKDKLFKAIVEALR